MPNSICRRHRGLFPLCSTIHVTALSFLWGTTTSPKHQKVILKGATILHASDPPPHRMPMTQASETILIPSYLWPPWLHQELGTAPKPGKSMIPPQISPSGTQLGIHEPGRKMKATHKEKWGPVSTTLWQLPRVPGRSGHSWLCKPIKFPFLGKLVHTGFHLKAPRQSQ